MKLEYLLEMDQVCISYEREVLRNVNLKVRPGEILALVGESGCGKTTLLNAVLGLSGKRTALTRGTIRFAGKSVTDMTAREREGLLGTQITMLYQDPGAAFNPIRTYKRQFAEMLRSHGSFEGKASYEKIQECFEKLKLPDGKKILESCPYEMSGGMNQRIAIAAVMLLHPRLLLADEPTSALDVGTQKQAAEELLRMRELTGMGMVLVTHHLGLAAKMADRIGVMYQGELIEQDETKNVLKRPKHPYTRELLAAVPVLGEWLRRVESCERG